MITQIIMIYVITNKNNLLYNEALKPLQKMPSTISSTNGAGKADSLALPAKIILRIVVTDILNDFTSPLKIIRQLTIFNLFTK